ncbi:MAG TPA: NUDIX hydrolase [Candidatus Thermoplasmatota archaeon]|nr:NUDIX hydrolase [Candidatus Thermoplasmatota archaeon]
MREAYCATCGGPLEAFSDHGVQRRRCARCGAVAYRNSKPCVGAIIRRGDRVLLSKRAREPHAGLWDLPGGFLESGEHPEEGVLREVREETGLRAEVVRLVGVQTGKYGDDDTLNLVYELAAEGDAAPADDSLELRWFPLDALPPMAFDHERELLLRMRTT